MNLLYEEEDSRASAINDYSVVRNDFLDLIVNEGKFGCHFSED